MNDVLIDCAFGEGHQAWICQRRQFRRKITRFNDNDLVGRWLKTQPCEIDDIVIWPSLGAEDKGNAFDLHNCFSQTRRRCWKKKDHLCRCFDGFASKRIECSTYREW